MVPRAPKMSLNFLVIFLSSYSSKMASLGSSGEAATTLPSLSRRI